MTTPGQKCGNCKWLADVLAPRILNEPAYFCNFSLNERLIPHGFMFHLAPMRVTDGTTCPTWKERGK